MAMGVSLFTENPVSVEEMNEMASVCTSKICQMANDQIEKFISWWKGKNYSSSFEPNFNANFETNFAMKNMKLYSNLLRSNVVCEKFFFLV